MSMTQRELIDYCNGRDGKCSDVCLHNSRECDAFVGKYRCVPYLSNITQPELYSDDVIEVQDGEEYKIIQTITYTYDGKHPTNKDYLIEVLSGSADDGVASYESVAKYDIACPYRRDCDCLNERENNEYGTDEYEEGCVRCKLAWLDRKYDTYPSDDGIWERKGDTE